MLRSKPKGKYLKKVEREEELDQALIWEEEHDHEKPSQGKEGTGAHTGLA